jgi:hypothetical protein
MKNVFYTKAELLSGQLLYARLNGELRAFRAIWHDADSARFPYARALAVGAIN